MVTIHRPTFWRQNLEQCPETIRKNVKYKARNKYKFALILKRRKYRISIIKHFQILKARYNRTWNKTLTTALVTRAAICKGRIEITNTNVFSSNRSMECGISNIR